MVNCKPSFVVVDEKISKANQIELKELLKCGATKVKDEALKYYDFKGATRKDLLNIYEWTRHKDVRKRINDELIYR